MQRPIAGVALAALLGFTAGLIAPWAWQSLGPGLTAERGASTATDVSGPGIMLAAAPTTIAVPRSTTTEALTPTGITGTTGTTGMIGTIGPPPATAAGIAIMMSAEVELAAATDDLRVSLDLPPIIPDPGLETYARDWAIHLAGLGELEHSDIASLLGPWAVVGENVAQGGDMALIFGSLVASPPHLEIMIDPAFTVGGVGVAADRSGQLWACQVFAGPELPTPAPTVTLPSLPPTTLTLPAAPLP